jgi:hypothetical protein
LSDFLQNFIFLVMAAMLVGRGIVGHNSERGEHSRTIPPKFGSNWPSGFRVDLNAKS